MQVVFGIYRSPIAVGKEAVYYMLKLFLPAFAVATGGRGRQHPKEVIKEQPPARNLSEGFNRVHMLLTRGHNLV